MHLREIQSVEATDSSHYFPDLDGRDLLYLATALAGEVGETCNVIKKHHRDKLHWVETQLKLYHELPDILIYLVMLADAMGIDLQAAYADKKEYNNARFRPKSE